MRQAICKRPKALRLTPPKQGSLVTSIRHPTTSITRRLTLPKIFGFLFHSHDRRRGETACSASAFCTRSNHSGERRRGDGDQATGRLLLAHGLLPIVQAEMGAELERAEAQAALSRFCVDRGGDRPEREAPSADGQSEWGWRQLVHGKLGVFAHVHRLKAQHDAFFGNAERH